VHSSTSVLNVFSLLIAKPYSVLSIQCIQLGCWVLRLSIHSHLLARSILVEYLMHTVLSPVTLCIFCSHPLHLIWRELKATQRAWGFSLAFSWASNFP
jgi:hypothetical protein